MNNCFSFIFNIYNNLINKNISDTNSTTPNLPQYIQKTIIKLICQHINNFNKNSTTTYEYYYFFKESQSEINKLILNLSLVSHKWFEIVSNNINTVIGYDKYESLKSNDGNSKPLSIIKMSNIKYLIIYNQHLSSFSECSNDKINIIKNHHENFKKLIISRPLYAIDKMPRANNFNVPWFNEKEIKCDLNCLYFRNYKWEIDKLKNKFSKIYSIVISSTYINDNQYITDIFNHYYKSLVSVTIDQKDGYSVSNLWSLFENGSFSNIESIDIKSFITFQDIQLIFKSSKLLRQVCLVFCFHKLIYYFSSYSDKQTGKVLNCTCYSLQRSSIHSNNKNEDIIEFHRNWSILVTILQTSNIKHLSIEHSCHNERGFWKYNPCNQIEHSNETILNSFYNEIAMLVSSIPSLKMFTLKNAIMYKIFELITTKHQNKSITKFQMTSYYASYFIGSKFNSTISLFNTLKKDGKYSHIDYLKISNYNSSPGMIGYRKQEIYEFKK